MAVNKKSTERFWSSIKLLIDAGHKATEIERKLKGQVTAREIYAKKKEWAKDAYKKDSRFARFHTPIYKKWRQSVLKRDGFRCIICKRGYKEVRALQADHILPYSVCVEKRFDISNGQTLCVYHHKRTPTFGRRAREGNHTVESNNEWVRRERELWATRQLKAKMDKQNSLRRQSRAFKRNTR